MASALDDLLESIDPQRTTEECSRRADDATNSFPVESGQITNWNDYRFLLSRFVTHVECHILRIPPDRMPEMSADFAWGRCCHILVREYGHNGEKAAFEMVRTGNEGGLRAVLRKIGGSLVSQYAGNEVTARVYHYWNSLSVDEKIAAGYEYLEKCGHLLPSELTEGSAVRIRANLPQVLREHPKLVQRLRGVGREQVHFRD